MRARPACTPPGVVVWAVGDVHGRLDLLNPLLDAIEADAAISPAARKVVVMLGDYVDRGPDSRGVIDRLLRLPHGDGRERRFLRGNHEDRMEAFLSDPELGPGWCDYGGREALRSYGVTPPAMRGDADGWVEAARALNAALGPDHRAFLRDLEYSVEIGDYFFAHAGARPGVALADQSQQDLMWVRNAFLSDPRPFERVVVHGHTPEDVLIADHRRIGVDTGAYATGVLSAVRLEGTTRALIQTAVDGRAVSVRRTSLSG